MLSLRVNNQFIDLGDDTSISWELRNPMFFDKGSRSYPFRIPTTPNNIKILGFRHRIEGSSDPYQEFPCAIVFNGIDIFRGTLKFTVFNKEYYEGMVYENEGSFYYKSKNINLWEVNLGEIWSHNEYYGLQYINDCKNRFYPERNVAFPMIPNEFYLDPPTEDKKQKFINYYAEDGQIYEYTPKDSVNPALGEHKNIIIPFVYFRHVLKMVLRNLGYSDGAVQDQVFSSDPTYNHLLIYNSLSCNNLCVEFPYDMGHIFLNLHIPKITILDFITAIESYFNCRFFVNDLEKTIRIIPLNQAVNNATAIDFSTGILIGQSIELDDKTTGFKLTIPIDSSDDYLQDWAAAQEFYLKNLCSPVDSVGQLPAWPFVIVNNVRYVKSVNKFYRFLPDKTWFLDDWAFTALFSTKLIGDFTTDRDFALCALKNAMPNSTWENWYCPCGNEQREWMDIPFKIFFTKLSYLHGMFDYTAMTGTDSYENLYLWFNGANNVYERHHKDWLDFLSTTKVVKIQRIFSFKEIRDFDFSRKYLIGDNKFFIRRIQVTFKKDRIAPALMECLTVK